MAGGRKPIVLLIVGCKTSAMEQAPPPANPPVPPPADTRDKLFAWGMLISGAVFIALYWVLFFFTALTLPNFVKRGEAEAFDLPSQVYLGFERAFPAADGFVAVCLFLSGVFLLQRRRVAVLYGLVGAGGLIFLALMDVSFNVEHGLYGPDTLRSDPGMILEVVINGLCLFGGAFVATYLWRHPLSQTGVQGP